ncbi:phosphoglycerate kinase [Candidatus Saccharibacteria bacterium]|nr:phosphoglycerate kinase [Candidatus Saccharibacteria bacterium]
MVKTIKGVKPKGKRVVLRADLDVPLRQAQVKLEVGEDYRLKAFLPTLKLLLNGGAKVLITGHLGRPEGKVDPELSLKPVADWFSSKLGREVKFLSNYSLLSSNYSLAMLENLRFWPGEEKNPSSSSGQAFAKKLASLGDIYVNEAFAASHRPHASISALPKLLPSFAGLRLGEEVAHLSGVVKNPERPLVFILGGAKTETKAPLVAAFAKVADKVLLGGLLMFRQDLEGVEGVVFPTDAVDAYDIGPKSIKLFLSEAKKAKTLVWNGPLGKWEDKRYEFATRALAEALAAHPGKTVIGGGDTIAALSAFDLLGEMDYVSLGGGAMLEFLAGKKLPGLEALGYYA